MPSITFLEPLVWNPTDPAGFEPTNVFSASDRRTTANTELTYTVEGSIDYPGLGLVLVQLVMRPTDRFVVDGAGGPPGGEVAEMNILVQRGGAFVMIAEITGLGLLASDVAGLTSGAVLSSGRDALSGSEGDDLYYGGDDGDTLDGFGGNDVLGGGAGADRLRGGDGDDVLSGGTAVDNDTLIGGAGADSLYGGGGSDTFIYETVSDSLFGYDGAAGQFRGDVIYDFRSSDWIDLRAVAGNIIIADLGAGQNKFIYIDSDGDGLAEDGEGQIILYGDGLSQIPTSILIGNRGLTYYGSNDADYAYGRNGQDVLVGGGGADRFNGFEGGDALYLGAQDGAGDTVFIGRGQSNYSATDALGSEADRVYDFTPGEDRLYFSLGDNSLMSAMIQEFGGSTYVYVNRDGDNDFDDTVILVNTTGVTLNDLVLGTGVSSAAPVAMEVADPIADAISDAFQSWSHDLGRDDGWML